MIRYTVENTLSCFYFRDSDLIGAEQTEGQLCLHFKQAVVLGQDRRVMPECTPCAMNPGIDRYAAPELTVTALDGQIVSILKGGCWSRDANGKSVEIYPPRFLERWEYPEFWNHLSGSNHVYDFTFDEEMQTWVVSFFMENEGDYYELTFTASRITAQWENFGKPAWYWKEG